ncbi:MAG: tetratricopeptide repeat protein, partial [Thermoplasmata archaeon]|nr:tetratricopeptide repeat protein [Thermoplasmata archaeon]
SGAYMSFAIAYQLKEDYDKSFDYFQKTIALREELGMPYRLADGLYECGVMLTSKGDTELARDYLTRSLSIFKKINSATMIQRAEKALAFVEAGVLVTA